MHILHLIILVRLTVLFMYFQTPLIMLLCLLKLQRKRCKTVTTHRTNNSQYVKLFKVCKSMHRRTIQINHQQDATVFQFIILTFIYTSICFGHFPAHPQELDDCSGSLWFYLRIVVIVVPDHEHSTTVTTI